MPLFLDVLEVAVFLARDEIVHDDGDFGETRLRDRARSPLRHQEIGGAHQFGNVVAVSEHRHRRRQRRCEFVQLRRSDLFRPVTTTRWSGNFDFASASVVGSSLPPPSPPAIKSAIVFSEGSRACTRSLRLRIGDVFEFRMHGVPEMVDAIDRHAAGLSRADTLHAPERRPHPLRARASLRARGRDP